MLFHLTDLLMSEIYDNDQIHDDVKQSNWEILFVEVINERSGLVAGDIKE